MTDCSGLFVWAYKQYDEKIYHGSNTIWRDYCSRQGKLKDGQRCDGIALRPGTAVFLLDDTGRHHIGIYAGGDTCIEAKGTKYGVVTSKPSHWDEWGELSAVDYSMYPEEHIPPRRPTLKRGDRGDEVKDLQTMLVRCGYTIEIDGAFGSKTEAAVKAFQRNAGITADGIVGPKTWEELGYATNGIIPDDGLEDPDEDELPDDEPNIEADEELEDLMDIQNYLIRALEKVNVMINKKGGGAL